MLEDRPSLTADSNSRTHIVHVLMQFAMAVRHRKHVVVAALVITALLGGLYYATATRYYSARATLLIRQSGAAQTGSTSLQPQGGVEQGLMPTYEGLITSARVIEGAIASLRPEDCVDLADVAREAWPAVLQKQLAAKTVFNTNMIDIEYRSKNPQAAVSVVGAVIASYLDFMDKTHKHTAGEIMHILSVERDKLSALLRQKYAELESRRKEIGYFDVRTDSKFLHPVVQRAVEFNSALIAARREQVDIRATLAALEAALGRGDDLEQYLISVADSVGKEMLLAILGFSTRDATTQARLQEMLVQYEASLETYKDHYGKANPKMVDTVRRIEMVRQQLDGYQEQIQQRLAQIQNNQLGPTLVGMLTQQLNESVQRERLLEEQFQRAQAEASQFSGALAEIAILEHELEQDRGLYDGLVTRLSSIDLQEEGAEVRVSVVNDPIKARSPISPSLKKVAFMALVAGLAIGLAAVYVLDILDDRFRSTEELQAQLGAPVMALVRQLRASDAIGLESLQVYAAPDAPETEAFRTLRTALSFAEFESRRLVVSSAEPGDGKTTILANLAVSYAVAGKRTLLIDADLRRPGLSTMLDLRSADGLSSIIRGDRDTVRLAEQLVRPSGVANLDLLPAGPRPTNPAELLAGQPMADLLAWAEGLYDQILIDSPPALAASDTALVGRLVDGVVLVIQPTKNRRRLVLRAAESLRSLRIHLFGLVVNRVGTGPTEQYDYGGDYGIDEDAASVETIAARQAA